MNNVQRALFLGLSVTGLITTATANNGWTWEQIHDDYNQGGKGLALAARPLWHIGAECGHWPCFPGWATQGANDDIVPPAKLYYYPNLDSSRGDDPNGCPWPGAINKDTSPFPTYFTVTKCCDGDTQFPEFRVTYSVFFKKDGYISTGHDYDWEDATIIWRRDPSDWKFYRDELLMERHGPRIPIDYRDVRSTINEDGDWTADGVQDQDHPKLYFGSAKHAVFHIKNTQFCDIGSDANGLPEDEFNTAYRSDNWSHMSWPDNLISAGKDTALGQKMMAYGPFSGLSNPGKLQTQVCGLTASDRVCKPRLTDPI
ncbi:MAG: hypothetical protein M1839_007619 [Geoglossum umbratile]|nr:MAG: hypothetical protein M1839_007619 [Geoglossum umbratile]